MTADPRPRLSLHRTSAIALAVLLLIGAAATVLVRTLVSGEQRTVLQQRATEVAAVLQVFGTTMEGTLAATGAVARATDIDPRTVRRVADEQRAINGFSSLSILAVDGERLTPLVRSGPVPRLISQGTASHIAHVREAGDMTRLVWPVGSGFTRVIGVALGPPAAPANTVLYAEYSLLPQGDAGGTMGSQTVANEDEASAEMIEAFRGLDFAIYVGPREDPSSLLFGTIASPGPEAVHVDAPFGADGFTIAVEASEPLVGTFIRNLPWVAVAFALVLAAAGTALIEVILRRRDGALALVGELEAKNTALDRALTEQREAEDRLMRVQRMEAVGQLAGGIAHDFNNLLAAILASARFAAEDIGDHPAREDLDEIVRAAGRAAELTRQLLTYSRKEQAEPRVFHLGANVASMERLIRRTIGEQVTLAMDLGGTGRINADPGQIEQVVMNLALNARDAVGPGGTVTIQTSDVTIGSEEDAELPPGRYVRLSVIDTGHGMSDEVAARALEPFFTTKSRGSGTGMGLAITDGIVKRWGGTTRIVTSPGTGTTVHVTLPATDASLTRHEAPTPPARGRGETVLLVEDEPGVRRTTKRMLERNGYRVLDARDGLEAIQRFARSVDILLTDVMMPGGLTGLDLTDHLRSERPDLKVLLMSAYSADVAVAGGAGSTVELLEKPFTEEQLLSELRRIMDAGEGNLL